MYMIKPKYKKTLDKYLNWAKNSSNLFKPDLVKQSIEALSAEIIMYQYESCGVPIPQECSNPEILSLYIQGKTCRDFFITQWIKDIKQGLAFKQEFYNELISLGDNPDKVFKGVSNNYIAMFPTYFKVMNNHQIDIAISLLDTIYNEYYLYNN